MHIRVGSMTMSMITVLLCLVPVSRNMSAVTSDVPPSAKKKQNLSRSHSLPAASLPASLPEVGTGQQKRRGRGFISASIAEELDAQSSLGKSCGRCMSLFVLFIFLS